MARPVTDVTELAKQCRKIPQKLMVQLFGAKQRIELLRFEQQWNCPIGSATVDLFSAIRFFREFFLKNGQVLREIVKSGDADPALVTQLHQSRARKMEAEARAAELRVEQKEGTLCETKVIHAMLAKLLGHFQSAAQQAQRQWGSEGFEMFNGLQAAVREEVRQLTQGAPPAGSTTDIHTAKKKSRGGKK